MKKIIVLCSVMFSVLGFSQNYQQKFLQSFDEGDFQKQQQVLSEWEKDNPTDVELFVAYFNYHFHKSKRSENQREEAEKGLKKISEGIRLYPNRIDLRFGKIFVLGSFSEWDAFTNEIIEVINVSVQNKNAWLGKNNQPKKNAEQMMLDVIQDYQVQLYETGKKSLLLNMRKIADEVLKHYPNHIKSMSNKVITYVAFDEYEKALLLLLKAEEISPTDKVILGNIAYIYKLKGETEKEAEYYQKIEKLK